jgi:hypothetical protein
MVALTVEFVLLVILTQQDENIKNNSFGSPNRLNPVRGFLHRIFNQTHLCVQIV